MELEEATKVMLDAQAKLRTPNGVNIPPFMSEQMMRLAQATGAIEQHLAEFEREYEIKQAERLHHYMIEKAESATKAEKSVKVELGKLKGDIAYFSRIVSSAWKQVGTTQSRFNHLTRENTHQL